MARMSALSGSVRNQLALWKRLPESAGFGISSGVGCRILGALIFTINPSMKPENPTPPSPVLVVCLCAQWCGVCGEYRERFAQAQDKFSQARFLWIDVEDEADLLHPIDVENFPTLLLAVGDEPRFFGPVTPQASTLERLIRSQAENTDAPALGCREVADLLGRIRAAHPG